MTAAQFARQEYPGSYYAATANDGTRQPELDGHSEADVCIVGAGYTGLATAIGLAERSYRVAVLEANRIGWGASGRNGGQLIGGIGGERRLLARYGPLVADRLWELRWRGHRIIEERVRRYDIDCDLKFGYVDVAIRPRHLRALEADWRELERRGFPHEFRLLDANEIRDLLGTRAYIGGLLNMGNGHLHPLNLCLGEARAARELGVQIYEHSPVLGIRHGRRPRVQTERGEVDCDAVVLAGNAYHALERRRLSGLVFPAGSFIIATEPLPVERIREINPRDLAVCDANHLLNYFRLSSDGRLLFGGRHNLSGREPQSIAAALRPRMLRVYPQLAETRIDYEWGGRVGVVLNRVPVVGRIDGNIYYAQGYTGHGVNVTHLMGEILAEAISGTLERFDLFARLPHWRIPLGQRFGNQLVSLGLLYYRLLDTL